MAPKESQICRGYLVCTGCSEIDHMQDCFHSIDPCILRQLQILQARHYQCRSLLEYVAGK